MKQTHKNINTKINIKNETTKKRLQTNQIQQIVQIHVKRMEDEEDIELSKIYLAGRPTPPSRRPIEMYFTILLLLLFTSICCYIIIVLVH